MNTALEDRGLFRRPQQTTDKLCHKVYPDFRQVGCHGVHDRQQGRPAAAVRARGIIRIQISSNGRNYEKRLSTIASYPVMGNNAVEVVRYTEPIQSADRGLVWINQKQYFKGVPPEVWNFCIGGSQICQKWLKDREGRSLSHKDIQHYQRIVMALKETIELMAGIDILIKHRQVDRGKLSNAAHPIGQV